MVKKKNIILLIIDTLREDKSGPIWEILKKKGFRSYPGAIAPSPWTVPSHASIFTGKYPLEHGAHETKEKKAFKVAIKDRDGFLSKELKDLGYRNHLFSANPYITSTFGYTHFDHEIDLVHEAKMDLLTRDESTEMFRLRKELGTTGKMVDHLLKNGKIPLLMKGVLNRIATSDPATWLYHQYQFKVRSWPKEKGASKMVEGVMRAPLEDPKRPDFMMINMMEVHEPYFENPMLSMKLNLNDELFQERVDGDFKKKLESAYNSSVDRVAGKVNRMVSILEEKENLDDTLMIVTSDHGQLLGEHNQLGHGTFLHEELLKVPLFIRYPEGSQPTKGPQKDGHISLKNLYGFILSMAGDGSCNDRALYDETVFAETHGISNVYKPDEDIEREKMERLERFKVAIYSDTSKAVFDVPSFKIESMTERKDDVTEKTKKEIKEKTLSFLSRLEKTKISKVSFSRKI